jgi:hypothetical protein
MTPAEFTATKLWLSNCHNMATYTPLSLRPDELPTVSDSVARWNPTNLNYEEWFDWAVRIGAQGVMPITTHWDGFCIWPSNVSPRNITASPWWNLSGQRNPLAEFVRHARMRSLKVGLYFCVRDGYYEASGTGTYTAWTIAKLTELLDGTYGEIDYLFLDGWGDTWVAGPGFDDVDYDAVVAAVADLSNCVFCVNDHEHTGPTVHGNISLWERQVDGVPAADFDVFPAVCLHDTIHTNSTWFRHSDSAADTKAGASVPLGRKYLMRKRGYVDMINVSTDLDGTMGADTRLLLAGMTTKELPVTLSETFSLLSTETAPVTLQTRTTWTKYFGGGVSISINPSGEAWATSTGAGYYRNDLSFADGRTRLKFKFNSVPTNFSMGVQLRSDGTTAHDDRWVLEKTGSTITLTLYANNSGLSVLDSALFDETLVVGQEYWLDIEKVGSEVIGTLWVEVDGEMEIWARRIATSSTNSVAGYPAFYIVDSTGSASAGIHVTGFIACEDYNTAPLSPTLSVVSDETNGNHLAIRTFSPTAYTKIYRSDDNGLTYSIAGFTSGNVFVDSELGTGTALYKSKAVDSSWNQSDYGNTVLMTGTAPVSDAGGGGTSTADTRDLEPVQFTWKMSRRSDGTIVSTNTLRIAPGESIRAGFDCDLQLVLPTGTVLRSMTVPTPASGDVTATKLGVDPKVAKVEVAADSEAEVTEGTTYYVRTTVINSNNAGPVTLLGKVILVAEPTSP